MKKKHYLFFTFIAAAFAQSLNAQTCRSDITPTTPTQDFILHDNGTVTHHKTGLMWMRCALGQNWNGVTCTGSGQGHNWQYALHADGFNFADHGDWRLPNIKELASIVEQACITPAINATVFPTTPSTGFWSASPYADNVLDAWVVHFGYGVGNDSINPETYGSLHVRLVRGGQ